MAIGSVFLEPELIFRSGLVICAVAAVCAIAAAVALRLSKARLDKQLDAEFGKRRR